MKNRSQAGQKDTASKAASQTKIPKANRRHGGGAKSGATVRFMLLHPVTGRIIGNFSLPIAVANRLRALARAEKVTIPEIVERAVRAFIARREAEGRAAH